MAGWWSNGSRCQRPDSRLLRESEEGRLEFKYDSPGKSGSYPHPYYLPSTTEGDVMRRERREGKGRSSLENMYRFILLAAAVALVAIFAWRRTLNFHILE